MSPHVIRYFTSRPGAAGPRYFWQPSQQLRAAGFKITRLAADLSAALIEAETLNKTVDEWRAGGPIAAGAKITSPKTAARSPTENGIYVIRSKSGSCKIGISGKPLRRIKQLHPGSSDELGLIFYFRSTLALAVERRAHALLAGKRLNSEWFDVDGDQAVAAVMEAMRTVFA